MPWGNAAIAARQHRGAIAHLSRHFPGFTGRVLVPGVAVPVSSTAQLSGLGFSLKPPAWLRKAATEIIHGTKVAVPSVTIPLPGGGSIITPSTKPTLPEQAELLAANIPGGWVTIAGVGLLAGLLLMKSMRR
jgi:hypothetical protein